VDLHICASIVVCVSVYVRNGIPLMPMRGGCSCEPRRSGLVDDVRAVTPVLTQMIYALDRNTLGHGAPGRHS
jgi:hypothetical protein